MKTLIASFTLALALALALAVASFAPAALACDGAATATTAVNTPKDAPPQKSEVVTSAADAKAAEPAFKMVSVDDVEKSLAALKKDKKAFVVLDANGKDTRQTQGFIPTAVLLPSASDYDLALLPKDKSTPVVFYCANEKCTASHTAAQRAIKSGCTDVAVLGAGIAGWVKAGKPVEKQPVG